MKIRTSHCVHQPLFGNSGPTAICALLLVLVGVQGNSNAQQIANPPTNEASSAPVHIYPPHLQPKDVADQVSVKSVSSPQNSLLQQGNQPPLMLPQPPMTNSPTVLTPAPYAGHSQLSSPSLFEPPPFTMTDPNFDTSPEVSHGPAVGHSVQAFPETDVSSTTEPLQRQPANDLSWWESDISQPILRQRQPITLTLETAIALALSEAPELQVLHSDWFIQQVEITRQDAVFDWATFVETVWNRDSAPVSSALDGATNRLRSRTANANAGVRKLLRDGGEFEISQNLGLRSSNSQFISPNNQGNSRLQFEWRHPLLRGGGEDYNSSRIRIAAIEKDSAFDRFQVGVQDHLLEVATAYWMLVLRRGRFVQAVASWQRSIEIEEEMKRRVNVDVTPVMLDRTRAEVARRLATSIEAEHDTIRAQDALLRLIHGSRFVEFVNNEIVTITMPLKESAAILAEPQIQKALRNRSEVHRSIRDIKMAAVRFEVADNEILPVLDMTLTGYVAGLRGNNDIGGSFLNQFTEGEPGLGIGITYELPYRNRAAEAVSEQSKIGIKRMQAQLQTTIADVTEDVRAQVIQRNKHGAVLKNQWEALAREKRLLKYSEVRREALADGTRVADLYLENLLQMQRRLEAAEFTYLQSQIRYAVADNSLLRSISCIDELSNDTNAACGPAAAVRQAASSRMFSGSAVPNSTSVLPVGHATFQNVLATDAPVSPVAR